MLLQLQLSVLHWRLPCIYWVRLGCTWWRVREPHTETLTVEAAAEHGLPATPLYSHSGIGRSRSLRGAEGEAHHEALHAALERHSANSADTGGSRSSRLPAAAGPPAAPLNPKIALRPYGPSEAPNWGEIESFYWSRDTATS